MTLYSVCCFLKSTSAFAPIKFHNVLKHNKDAGSVQNCQGGWLFFNQKTIVFNISTTTKSFCCRQKVFVVQQAVFVVQQTAQIRRQKVFVVQQKVFVVQQTV
jgi:hypothetical protein